MILDEATSSVDTVTEQHIRQAMLSITQGRTSFLLIRDGRIAEQGTHQQLMELGGEYARMYMTQMGQI